ncbi:MAG: stage II sporulation protein P [Eubacteriales bacterium]|nr:stage II sporulation protein P [Eubacteriales bacterium]
MAALLCLCCGIGLGLSKRSDTPKAALPALSYSVEEDVTPVATPTSSFTLENVFSLPSEPPAPTVSSIALPSPSAPPEDGFSIEVLKTEGKPKPRILIYHTHTYEAYEKQPEANYQETQQWRTADPEYNVMRIGDELAALLTGLGFEVVHDRTAFEPPELSSAYTRSLAMLTQRLAAGESYNLYIDLHRDAYSGSDTSTNIVQAGNLELARLMLLIGKGEGMTGQGFAEKPDWETNLKVASAITEGLNQQVNGLCKDVMVKSGRYNQHVAPHCVLIEAGNNRNTLRQVLAAMPYLADAISQAFTSTIAVP